MYSLTYKRIRSWRRILAAARVFMTARLLMTRYGWMKAAYCQMKVLDLASVSPSCFVRRLDDDDSRQVRCLRRRFIDFPSPDGYARNQRTFYCSNKIALNLINFLRNTSNFLLLRGSHICVALLCKIYDRVTRWRGKFYVKHKQYFEVLKKIKYRFLH